MPRRRYLTCRGLTYSLTDWATITGISPKTISSRIARGQDVEKALSYRPCTPGERATRGRNRSPWG